MTAPAPNELHPATRVTRQFRTHPAEWETFQTTTGPKAASGVLRTLMRLYVEDERLRRRVGKTPDPAPDQRYGPKPTAAPTS